MSQIKGWMPASPKFTEDDLLVFVTRILERSTSHKNFSIRPASKHLERKLGYDADVVALYQVYMQFKVAKYAYQTNSKFINGRKSFGFDDTLGVMHFGLRAPPRNISTPEDLQHNCLFRLSLIYPGRAIYVAPTFTDDSLLSSLAIPWHHAYSHLSPMVLKQSTIQVGKLNFSCSSIPVLQNLVSIFPHAPVKTYKHSYAFNFSNEVSFHSDPENIPKGSRSFLSLIVDKYSGAIGDMKVPGWESPEQIIERDRTITQEVFRGQNSQVQNFLEEVGATDQRNPIRSRWILNRALEEFCGIHSFCLVKYRN